MKRIVLFSDGTWNKVEAVQTNVVRLARAVSPMAPGNVPQIVFYDRGVGTGNVLDLALGGAFGSGLDRNVKDLYRFVAQNYLPDDQIYLIGFSRGAYTARSAAGMIRNCGVLKKEHLDLIETDAYSLYRSPTDAPDSSAAERFRAKYSHADQTPIRFLGVFDTVGERGVPLPKLRQGLARIPGFSRWHRRNYEFHDMALSSTVQHAYHAVAIDERRSAFPANLWTNVDRPNIQQHWFTGVHSDIGGGREQLNFSEISLRAMADAAKTADLALDEALLPSRDRLDWRAKLSKSPAGFWRPTGATDRPIDEADDVDQTSKDRYCSDEWDYDPPGLRAYLERAGHTC